MAVYTEVPFDEARDLLRRLGLGELAALHGVESGIENTNYFATATQGGTSVEYVLTLFERLTTLQLPFYLRLMKHLARHGLPVPDPAVDAGGALLHQVQGKPAVVVNRLPGRSALAPTEAHCAAVGTLLARMHLAARDFPLTQPNLRGLAWWNQTAPIVRPHLGAEQAALLQSELAYQNHVAAGSAYAALPRGPVHADLFRDNVLFEHGEITGVFDFYFAGVDSWLFDLAVCLNDWCIDLETGAHDAARAQSLLAAYAVVRPLAAAERRLLAAMLRAGALRFWISRLWDLHLPREAAMLKAHDPSHFERVLRQRVRHPVTL
ncbi:MAG: Homoserine kinase [Burkholderiaceae bacterium]|jgi:homoserine kinase type II|nr:MAG: Homoserine kinase [Burkholderiaceae bacterium]